MGAKSNKFKKLQLKTNQRKTNNNNKMRTKVDKKINLNQILRDIIEQKKRIQNKIYTN